MVKVVSVSVITLALATMGCQAQASRPPETPQASAQAAPPGPPPPAARPGVPPGHHHGAGAPGGGPWAPHERGDASHPHAACDGGHGHHHDGPGGHHGPGRPHGGGGKRAGKMGHGPGHMGPGGHGAEMMRELAALGVRLYPPPLVIRRAKDIGLTPEQVGKIRDEVLATQKRGVDLHAKMEHARVEVVRLLAADKVDERAVNAQIEEATKAQAEVHKLHVGSMLRVRALLTPEQRQKLDERTPRPRPSASPSAGTVGQADDDDDDDEDDGDAEG